MGQKPIYSHVLTQTAATVGPQTQDRVLGLGVRMSARGEAGFDGILGIWIVGKKRGKFLPVLYESATRLCMLERPALWP